MYSLLYLKWITNKDLLYSTWNSAQCYVAAWMGAEFGREWINVLCVAEVLCYSPETITTLFDNRLDPKTKQIFFLKMKDNDPQTCETFTVHDNNTTEPAQNKYEKSNLEETKIITDSSRYEYAHHPILEILLDLNITVISVNSWGGLWVPLSIQLLEIWFVHEVLYSRILFQCFSA